jgi:hypothetical protein
MNADSDDHRDLRAWLHAIDTKLAAGTLDAAFRREVLERGPAEARIWMDLRFDGVGV